MKWVLLLLAVACLCVQAADNKKKPADIQVVEINAVRASDQVSLDGRVRVTSLKPVKRLIIQFDYLADGKKIVSSKRMNADEDELQTGDETAFNVQSECPPKAFEFVVKAYRGNGDILTVENPGPFPIRD
jgi:hypothetical protein